MNSIGKITEELINRSPFLREAMTDDLINISALARKLKPEIEEIVGKEVKEGAIIMSIKRMTPWIYHRLKMKITNMMADLGDFIVRSNLVDYTFENSATSRFRQAELMQKINRDSDSFFTVCKGITETMFILNKANSEIVEKIYKDEQLISTNKDLASITVKLPRINTQIYGVYYYILKHLAWEGVNVMEIVSTSNEFTVIVHHDEVDKAFKILMQLKRKH